MQYTGELEQHFGHQVKVSLLPLPSLSCRAHPANVAATETQLKEVDAAARAMGLQIQIHNDNTSAEIDAAFETMSRERPDAVYVTTTWQGRQPAGVPASLGIGEQWPRGRHQPRP